MSHERRALLRIQPTPLLRPRTSLVRSLILYMSTLLGLIPRYSMTMMAAIGWSICSGIIGAATLFRWSCLAGMGSKGWETNRPKEEHIPRNRNEVYGRAPLYKRNGWYYLLTAEGGPGYNHTCTPARSRDIADHTKSTQISTSLPPKMLPLPLSSEQAMVTTLRPQPERRISFISRAVLSLNSAAAFSAVRWQSRRYTGVGMIGCM